MTTVDIDRSERGRREFAKVMTFDPPDDSSPSTTNGLIDFVFGEVWIWIRLDKIEFVLGCQAQIDSRITVDCQQTIDVFTCLLNLREKCRVEIRGELISKPQRFRYSSSHLAL